MTPKRKHADTSVKLPSNVPLKDIVTAMLGTPPPPAGDPSTRKTKIRKAAKKSKR